MVLYVKWRPSKCILGGRRLSPSGRRGVEENDHMEIDRKELIQSLGGEAAVAGMTHEQRADALEEFQIGKLDAEMAARKKAETFPTVAELEDQIETRTWRLGSGKLFRPGD